MCRICGCTNAARPPRGAAGEDTSTKQEAVNVSIAIGADVVRIYATSAVTLTVVRARTTGHKRAVGSHRAVRRAREIGRASERETERERVCNESLMQMVVTCRTCAEPATSLHRYMPTMPTVASLVLHAARGRSSRRQPADLLSSPAPCMSTQPEEDREDRGACAL